MLLGGPGGIRLKPNCAVCVCEPITYYSAWILIGTKGTKGERTEREGGEKGEDTVSWKRAVLLGSQAAEFEKALTLRGRKNYRFYSIKSQIVQQTFSCLLCLCNTQANYYLPCMLNYLLGLLLLSNNLMLVIHFPRTVVFIDLNWTCPTRDYEYL